MYNANNNAKPTIKFSKIRLPKYDVKIYLAILAMSLRETTHYRTRIAKQNANVTNKR